MRPIEHWPLWVIGAILMVMLSAAMQAGYFLGRRIYHGRQNAITRQGLGYIVSASLALLGLLLAFSFGASEERFNVRRRMVAEEADAFMSAYMYVLTLNDASKSALAPLILDYGRTRVAFYEAPSEPAAVQAESRSGQLQDAIWARALESARPGASGTTTVAALDKINRLFEVDATRRAEHFSRVPLATLQALMVFAVVSAGVIGMALSGGTRHYVASTAFLLVLTTTACLILGLDRQRSAGLLAQQAPMDRAVDRIERWEKTRIAGVPPAPPMGGAAR